MYCIRLSRKLKKSIQEILSWPVNEITLQMAYDLTKSDDFKKKLNDDYAANTWDEIPLEEQKDLFRMAFNRKVING